MANSPQQVVFIDSHVPDIADLLGGLAPGEVAFVIDATSDGVQQIAAILAANDLTDLSSISIVGHGASGAIELGATVLDDGDLSSHAGALAQIGAALAPGASLQLYSCDTASGATGQRFIADLSSFVGGAPVAAATQDIGQTATGENWTLDALAGPAAAPSGSAAAPAQPANPFTAAAEAKFAGTLSQPTTELWISGTAGGEQNIILHADDTGTGTASNVGTLFTPTSANNPSAGAGIDGLDLLQLDTENQTYFIATQNGTQTELLEGSLASALANPGATPTYTTLFSSSTDNANGISLTGLAVDPTSEQVFFDDGHDFDKVGYAGGPVTTLGSTGSTGSDPFLDGLALDLPHHVAYFISASSSTTTSTTLNGQPDPSDSNGHVHYNTVFTGAIYETSSLTASSSSVTISKLTDVDPATFGAIWDGEGDPGIAVDTTTGLVYFTTHSINGGAEGGIFALDPVTHQITTLFRQGAGGPTGILTAIQVDDATGKYYVSVINADGTGGAIYVGSLSGGTPTLFETIPTFNGNTINPVPEGFSLDNAPTLSAAPGSNTFTESTSNPASSNNTPVSVIAATADDSDNTALVSATVTISGLFAGDVLSATTAGTGITQSFDSATGVLTLSGKDTIADYQAVLNSITFTSTSDNPTDFGADNSRTLTWTVNDGLLSSAPQTTTVTVVGVNDPPTLSGTANASFTENGSAVTLSPAAAVSDPDNLNLAGATVAITGSTFAGDGDVLAADLAGTAITASYNAATETLVLSGTDTLAHYQSVLDTVTFVTASDNPTDFGADPTRTVTWTVDDGSASNATASATTTVSITAVNDPPTLAGTADASFTENGSPVALSPGAAVSDPDNLNLAGATVAITGGAFAGDGDLLAANVAGTAITASYNAATETLVLSGADTLAHYQSALDSVTFVTPSDNPTDFGADPTRTVTWTVDDGSASNATMSVTTTVSITAVNDPPTLAGTTNASFTENGSPVTLSPAAAVSDPDNLNLAGATVAITAGTFAGDGDVLAANLAGTAITASYNAATETLVLSGTDTLANYQSVLDTVAFVTASDNPDDFGADPTRTVTWQLDDAGGSNNLSAVSTTTVSITAVNDPPTLSNVATNANYTEQAAATTLSGSLAVSDPDNLTLAGATVRISGGTFAGDGDVLAANITGTAIAASYDAATETLVLSGADTLADYQSVLDSVTFFDASDNPTNFGSNATRTITWVLADGSASNNTSTVATTTLNVTAVNDAPTLAGVPSTASFSAGQTLTVAPAASVSDPDNLTLASATVQVTGGTFAGDSDVLAANVAGTDITASYNAATETLSLTGSDTLADYQQVLDSVTFTTGANPTNFGADPTRTLTWTVDDGSGSNNTATATTTISISTSLVKNDLDGDRRSDILFQDKVGSHFGPTLIDFMNGTSVAAQATLAGPGATWQLIGSGDFNADGKADILWQNADGTPQIWTMNGSSVTSEVTLSDPGSSWHAVATGDFNGDGGADIVFQNTNGTPQIWIMNGTSVAATATLPDPGKNETLIGTGDFNGDGKSDLVFQSPNGTPTIWLMNGTSVTATVTLPKPAGAGSEQLIGTGDFNGDGDADLLFQKSNGTPMIWTMNGTSVAATTTLANPGAQWNAVGTGDYNGDGKSDILFQNSNGTPQIWLMDGTSVTATATLPNPGAAWHANTG